MASQSLEDRLAAVEHELMQLKQRLDVEKLEAPVASWEKIFGIFADSEGFDEAVRLGREYRLSQRPDDEDEDASTTPSKGEACP